MQLTCHSVAVVLALVQKKHERNNTKNTVPTIQNTINTSTHITKTPKHYTTHTYTHTHTHTHTHTLQNKLQPQYKLKQTQYKIYTNEVVIIKYPQYEVTLVNMEPLSP